LKELHIRESKILHTTMFDALMENCFFYISRMYEFLHRLGHDQTSRHHLGLSALPLKADKRVRSGAAGFPNGEAQKSNFPYPHHSTSRLFLRQTLGLGGEAAFRELWPCT
jgi:hypothetical protein